jgi:hypothetical protein
MCVYKDGKKTITGPIMKALPLLLLLAALLAPPVQAQAIVPTPQAAYDGGGATLHWQQASDANWVELRRYRAGTASTLAVFDQRYQPDQWLVGRTFAHRDSYWQSGDAYALIERRYSPLSGLVWERSGTPYRDIFRVYLAPVGGS